jgi:phosphoribosylaminoimidazole-succinocarboxamide synthase
MLAADRFVRSGKVRDIYEFDQERLLLVASDRLSAFDVVLPTTIPDKGRVLTGLSRFWFAETAGIVPNHLLGTDPAEAAAIGPADALRGRSMVCRRANVVPIEAVVRGYLAGSGWKEYQATGAVCGVPLPPGLRESDRFAEPIFTPATKEEGGAHDVNISFDDMVDHLAAVPWLAGSMAGPLAEQVRDLSVRLYRYGSAVASRAGILLADTKFEFGLVGDEGLILVDEVLTPDSSRFWEAAAYEPGRPQASYDKQFVRDWLEAQAWDKRPPGPELPDDVVAGTRSRYVEAFERITGASFDRYLEEDVIAR